LRRAAALAILLVSTRGFGAGLSRPNVLGARSIGLGGAFTAIADDPTAVWHNPAGTAFYGDTSVYFGNELVLTQRGYTPSATSPLGIANSSAGAPDKNIVENTAPTYIPIIGVTTRFGFGKIPPNRFALSLLAYDVYGGSISFRPADVQNQGIQNTQILDFEVAPTLAYQVSDVLAIGAGVRIGINSFSVNDIEAAFKANLSLLGVGIGGTLGIMVRPHPRVQIGAVYRTSLSTTMSGNGPVAVTGGTTTNRDASLAISWPQSVSLGVAVRAHSRIIATVQGDWSGWSSVQNLSLQLAGLLPVVKPMRYMDSYALHVGVQGVVTRFLVLRLGFALDGNAIPDSTVRRENQDAPKATLAGGVGLHFWKVFIDAAFEGFLPLGTRTVAQQGTDNEGGAYKASVYTAELSAQVRF
jgi:long-chain fatty acid transport protein